LPRRVAKSAKASANSSSGLTKKAQSGWLCVTCDCSTQRVVEADEASRAAEQEGRHSEGAFHFDRVFQVDA